LRTGDVVLVAKYDMPTRSLKDLIMIVGAIREHGAGFESLGENNDTSTPAGRLVFHAFGSIAEFERERIAERTRKGLKTARSRGCVGGRPPALSIDQRERVRQMLDKTIGQSVRLPDYSKSA
jgi:DNA invertase Pin-like site-specific DNA recombinase